MELKKFILQNLWLHLKNTQHFAFIFHSLGTAKRLPSFLPDDSRKKLIDAAFKCCLGIGNIKFIQNLSILKYKIK
jgi:hypothetical protein